MVPTLAKGDESLVTRVKLQGNSDLNRTETFRRLSVYIVRRRLHCADVDLLWKDQNRWRVLGKAYLLDKKWR